MKIVYIISIILLSVLNADRCTEKNIKLKDEFLKLNSPSMIKIEYAAKFKRAISKKNPKTLVQKINRKKIDSYYANILYGTQTPTKKEQQRAKTTLNEFFLGDKLFKDNKSALDNYLSLVIKKEVNRIKKSIENVSKLANNDKCIDKNFIIPQDLNILYKK